MTTLDIRRLSGPAVLPFIPELARLRIGVFRDYPYLYDGDLAYEEQYLREYAAAPDSLMVLALASDAIVGASTGMPLLHAHTEFIAPFRTAGIEPARVFYFGESVLHPSCRGRGMGHLFFDERERHARALPGVNITAFCAVERPANHPARPPDYRPLDGFWNKRGYVKRNDLVTSFAWKETGEAAATDKPMTFWLKEWS